MADKLTFSEVHNCLFSCCVLYFLLTCVICSNRWFHIGLANNICFRTCLLIIWEGVKIIAVNVDWYRAYAVSNLQCLILLKLRIISSLTFDNFSICSLLKCVVGQRAQNSTINGSEIIMDLIQIADMCLAGVWQSHILQERIWGMSSAKISACSGGYNPKFENCCTLIFQQV